MLRDHFETAIHYLTGQSVAKLAQQQIGLAQVDEANEMEE